MLWMFLVLIEPFLMWTWRHLTNYSYSKIWGVQTKDGLIEFRMWQSINTLELNRYRQTPDPYTKYQTRHQKQDNYIWIFTYSIHFKSSYWFSFKPKGPPCEASDTYVDLPSAVVLSQMIYVTIYHCVHQQLAFTFRELCLLGIIIAIAYGSSGWPSSCMDGA